jgi:hypothetical protein
VIRVAGLATALALVVGGRALGGQSWRTLESSRQLRDSAPHRVRVEYGAGRIDVAATQAPVLYAMLLRYDESTASPVHRYDEGARSLTLGVDIETTRLRSLRDQTRGEMRLTLSRAVPLDLELDLGATKASLDLGGLDLRSLRLSSGASETLLDFSAPNAGRMGTLEIEIGAASFEARNLGNANASRIRVSGGVGRVDLDFGGRWTQDVAVDVDVALGKLTLRLPRDVGVRVEVDRVLASLDDGGLSRRGDAYFSDNWETAAHRLRIRAGTRFGGIELDRTAGG